MASLFTVVLGLLFFAYSLFVLFPRRKAKWRKGLTLPPGPPGLPIVGNLFQLGPEPHKKFDEWNRKYGPVVFLRLGCRPTLVTNSPHIAKEILKTQDHIFASRAPTVAGEYFSYGFNNIAIAPYGPMWRNHRRIAVTELLTPRRVETFASQRREEADIMVQRIWKNYHTAKVTDLQSTLGGLSMNIITRMLFSKRFFLGEPLTETISEEAKALATLHKAFGLMGLINISDYFPWLRRFDLQGYEAQMKPIRKEMDETYEAIIEEHRRKAKKENSENSHKDFVDLLLEAKDEQELPLSLTAIKGLMHDMIAAGTDTSSVSSEYIMAELLLNPEVMRKAQAEIDNKIGKDRFVEESDVMDFHYLRCVVKESQRLHSSGPFLIPHYSMEATELGGHYIPKGTTAIISLYGLGRNPDLWQNPEKFDPDRFAHEPNPDLREPEMRIVVFGGGRRGCPGATLGTYMVLLAVSRLIHCFDWTIPPGHTVDFTQEYGMTTPMKNHLQAIGKPRLPEHLYTQLSKT